MKKQKNIQILYFYSFFHSLIPAYVIERLFWEARGITVLEVVYTEIVYAATIMLLEVPTGILADKWSRKNLILLSAALGSLEFLLLIYSTEFWHFAAVVFLAGVSKSAFSGAANALLYDSLLVSKPGHLFEKHIGFIDAIGFFAAIPAALSGSILADKFGFEVNYWLSFGSSFLCVVFAIALVEPDQYSADEKGPGISVKDYILGSLHFFKARPGVCMVLLSGMSTGAAINYIYEFWQLYLDRIMIPVVFFGVFSAGIMVLSLPGSLFAHWLIKKYTQKALLKAVLIIFTIGFSYMAIIKGLSGLAFMFLICLASGLVNPIVTGYLHHRVPSEMRATIDSFHSLGLNTVRIVTGVGFGFFADRYDFFGGYAYIAFVCGLCLVIFIGYSKHVKT